MRSFFVVCICLLALPAFDVHAQSIDPADEALFGQYPAMTAQTGEVEVPELTNASDIFDSEAEKEAFFLLSLRETVERVSAQALAVTSLVAQVERASTLHREDAEWRAVEEEWVKLFSGYDAYKSELGRVSIEISGLAFRADVHLAALNIALDQRLYTLRDRVKRLRRRVTRPPAIE